MPVQGAAKKTGMVVLRCTWPLRRDMQMLPGCCWMPVQGAAKKTGMVFPCTMQYRKDRGTWPVTTCVFLVLPHFQIGPLVGHLGKAFSGCWMVWVVSLTAPGHGRGLPPFGGEYRPWEKSGWV